MSFVEILAPHSIKDCQLIVGRGKGRIEFDGCSQTVFDLRFVVGVELSAVHRNGGKIVISQKTLRIQFYRLLVPFPGFGEIALAELQVSHGFMRRRVARIFAQYLLKQSASRPWCAGRKRGSRRAPRPPGRG